MRNGIFISACVFALALPCAPVSAAPAFSSAAESYAPAAEPYAPAATPYALAAEPYAPVAEPAEAPETPVCPVRQLVRQAHQSQQENQPQQPYQVVAEPAEAPTHTVQTPRPDVKPLKTKAQRYVESVSCGEPLKSSVFGVLAVTEGGDTLVSWNSGTRMIPASTQKLVTTGLALHRLGPDFKYVTRLAYSGTVKDGVLDGDLYIVGGGDPTIASKDSIAMSRTALFSQWKSFLDKAGIRSISGRVIGDGRYFDGPAEHDTWSYQDIGTSYGTGCNGLSFYENAQDFKAAAGHSVGSPVNITPTFPVTPWMKYEYSCRTAPAGTGDQLYLFNSEFAPRAEVRGSFAIDRKPKTEEFGNRFGAYTCAHYFCEFLKGKGISVAQGPADIRLGRVRSDLSSSVAGPYASKVDEMKVIGLTYSPSLKRIARETNLKSDNFYAETLFRTLGRRYHHSASYDSTYIAVAEVLRDLGVNDGDVRIVDGSGLARHNYVSPSFFVRFLSAMMDSPCFADYVQTIARPGDRHYESRLREASASVKSRVHLKSGSMNGVRCFSGYIEPSVGSKSDTIIFSVMINNSLAPASRLDPIIDRIITLLAATN